MHARRQWYDGGGTDALDHAIDVGPENQFEPDLEPDPLRPLRRVIAGHAEFSARDPAEIYEECEEQDQLLGLAKGSTLQLFLEALDSH